MTPDVLILIGQLLASAIGGGAIKVLLDKFLPSADSRLKDQADIRQDLLERLEKSEARMDSLSKQFQERLDSVTAQFDARITRLTAELDEWKQKYYAMLEGYHLLKAENHSIREENHLLLSKLTAVQVAMQRLERQVGPIEPRNETPGPTVEQPGQGPSILKAEP